MLKSEYIIHTPAAVRAHRRVLKMISSVMSGGGLLDKDWWCSPHDEVTPINQETHHPASSLPAQLTSCLFALYASTSSYFYVPAGNVRDYDPGSSGFLLPINQRSREAQNRPTRQVLPCLFGVRWGLVMDSCLTGKKQWKQALHFLKQ